MAENYGSVRKGLTSEEAYRMNDGCDRKHLLLQVSLLRADQPQPHGIQPGNVKSKAHQKCSALIFGFFSVISGPQRPWPPERVLAQAVVTAVHFHFHNALMFAERCPMTPAVTLAERGFGHELSRGLRQTLCLSGLPVSPVR